MGRSNAAAQVLEILGQRPRGRLLEIPAGTGPVCAGAEKLGYRVVQADLFPRPGVRVVLADACAPLPFADASFDAVVSMEGIEHFEDQTGFVRECSRVLAADGALVLTTPNIQNLSSRFAALWSGHRSMRGGFLSEFRTLWGRDGDRLYHGHAFLIDAFRLRYILRVCGLSWSELRTTRISPGSLLLAPLLPLVWLAAWWTLLKGRSALRKLDRPPVPRDVERELFALATSPALLFGKKLVVLARKTEA